MESRYPEKFCGNRILEQKRPEGQLTGSKLLKKLIIIGGGIIAAMEAYFAYLDAKEKGFSIRVTVHEKNKTLLDTTVFNIFPSLTPDEILAVVPRGQELVKNI